MPQCYSENKVRNWCVTVAFAAQQGIEKLNRQRSYPKGSGIVQEDKTRTRKLQYKEAQMKRKEKSNSGKDMTFNKSAMPFKQGKQACAGCSRAPLWRTPGRKETVESITGIHTNAGRTASQWEAAVCSSGTQTRAL